MNNCTLRQIEDILSRSTYEEFIDIRNILKKDERKQVINLLKKYDKKFNEAARLVDEYNKRNRYEEELYKKGIVFVAGIDEVGRGPLAGPVYAAAVILDFNRPIYGVRDSKKLSESQRLRLAEEIKEKAVAYSIAFSTVEEIDRLNILNATKLAMKRAIDNLKIKPQHFLIDALRLDGIGENQTPIIKGDDMSVSIGAASIIAKVERDSYMNSLDVDYPQYAFGRNKGYGTKEHIDAIKKYGPRDIHRKTFIGNFVEF